MSKLTIAQAKRAIRQNKVAAVYVWVNVTPDDGNYFEISKKVALDRLMTYPGHEKSNAWIMDGGEGFDSLWIN